MALSGGSNGSMKPWLVVAGLIVTGLTIAAFSMGLFEVTDDTAGPRGPQGPQGLTGPTGAPGTTLYGDNGIVNINSTTLGLGGRLINDTTISQEDYALAISALSNLTIYSGPNFVFNYTGAGIKTIQNGYMSVVGDLILIGEDNVTFPESVLATVRLSDSTLVAHITLPNLGGIIQQGLTTSGQIFTGDTEITIYGGGKNVQVITGGSGSISFSAQDDLYIYSLDEDTGGESQYFLAERPNNSVLKLPMADAVNSVIPRTLVYFDVVTCDPNDVGTVFNRDPPPTVNDPSAEQNSLYVYMCYSALGETWIWDSSSNLYVTYTYTATFRDVGSNVVVVAGVVQTIAGAGDKHEYTQFQSYLGASVFAWLGGTPNSFILRKGGVYEVQVNECLDEASQVVTMVNSIFVDGVQQTFSDGTLSNAYTSRITTRQPYAIVKAFNDVSLTVEVVSVAPIGVGTMRLCTQGSLSIKQISVLTQ